MTLTVTHCSFGWTHRLRLRGFRVLVLCSLCLNDFLTAMFCCADERRGRNRSCTTSSRLDARRKFTVYCCLLQWSVSSQMDQPRSENLQRIRNQFDGFVSCWLYWLRTATPCVTHGRTDGRFRSVPTYLLKWYSEQVEDSSVSLFNRV